MVTEPSSSEVEADSFIVTYEATPHLPVAGAEPLNQVDQLFVGERFIGDEVLDDSGTLTSNTQLMN
ncbi:hypothetical protein G7085_20290 [Tessaracoccus sp. HDW20]|uniref:hypothetical protein n=1 Tax=Tessaracoccus coleopterorum TaxID=2714950 RepID=UPI0018D3D08B|nr:hypothetical protein [Tessaracoccus coleopterorum]NHB86070.1 hypothetical protein [Tessaracoccus coleopterorum]